MRITSPILQRRTSTMVTIGHPQSRKRGCLYSFVNPLAGSGRRLRGGLLVGPRVTHDGPDHLEPLAGHRLEGGVVCLLRACPMMIPRVADTHSMHRR